jgi:uncharacterized membrane protein
MAARIDKASRIRQPIRSGIVTLCRAQSAKRDPIAHRCVTVPSPDEAVVLTCQRASLRPTSAHIKQEDTEMSDLIAIIYPSEAKAEEVRQRLFELQKEYLITLSDAVIAVKTEAGPVKLNQLVNTTAIGAASGSFWGLLIGLIFLNPLLGVALGAASGALGGALSDYGIDDAFMKKLSETLQPGNAALFVLVKNMTPDKVLREIQDAGGTVLKTSLDDSKEQKLRDALAKAGAEQAAPKTTAA